jgi:hypothetical protein
MKKKSRFMSIGIASLLAIGIFTGCGVQNKETQEELSGAAVPVVYDDIEIGYGYDIAGSDYYNSGAFKKTAVLDIKKLSAENRIMQKNNAVETYLNVAVGTDLSKYSKDLTVKAGVNAGIGAFKGSIDTSMNLGESVSEESSFMTARAEIRVMEQYIDGVSGGVAGGANEDLQAYLMPAFKTDLEGNMDPGKFFNKYGTHIFTDIALGGRLDMNYKYTNSSHKTKQQLEVLVKASYGDIGGSAGTNMSKETEDIKSNASITIQSVGGSANGINVSSIDEAKAGYKDWAGSIDTSKPASLDFIGGPTKGSKLSDFGLPTWSFLDSNSDRYKELDAYFQQMLIDNGKYFSDLQNKALYVKDVYFGRNGNADKARNDLYRQLGSDLDTAVKLDYWDLNKGTGGDYIYMGWTTTTIPEEAMTDTYIGHATKAAKATAPSGYIKIDKDLNAGAGGQYIYLYYKRNSGTPIKSFGLEIMGQGKSGDFPAAGWTVDTTNLNDGIKKGNTINLWTKR